MNSVLDSTMATFLPPSSAHDLISPLNHQKQKAQHFDFHPADSAPIIDELNEFYAFIEVDQLAENLRLFQASFPSSSWVQTPEEEKKKYVVGWLRSLENQDGVIRYEATRCLLYLLQGCFAESNGPEEQLSYIVANAQLVRSCGGLLYIVDALKALAKKHDQLSIIPDSSLSRYGDKQYWLDEIQSEISMLLSILYPIVEIFRSDFSFSEELMALDPPLPLVFFGLIAGLKDRSARSYPAKKLLLVTWKVVLCVLGGEKELKRVKGVARELAGLDRVREEGKYL